MTAKGDTMTNRHDSLRAAFARAQVKTSAGEAGGEKETTMGSTRPLGQICRECGRLVDAYGIAWEDLGRNGWLGNIHWCRPVGESRRVRRTARR